MDITRISIEGGFLDGFDLALKPGLNVIIGARGTGKTSLIELIRYGLDSKSHTDDSKEKTLQHARSVLADGEVTISLSDFISDATVSRSSSDSSPRSNSEYASPIVLSQTEIETIGLSSTARLSLIDGFIPNRGSGTAKKGKIVNSIKSLYKEIQIVEKELIDDSDNDEKLHKIESEIKKLISEQEKLKSGGIGEAKKHEDLARITQNLTRMVAQDEMLNRFSAHVGEWIRSIENLTMFDRGLENWDGEDLDDPLLMLRLDYSHGVLAIESGLEEFQRMHAKAGGSIEKIKAARELLETNARSIRAELDSLTEGSGKLSRLLTQLETDKKRLITAGNLRLERIKRLNELRSRRDALFNEYCLIVEERSKLREEIADRLNKALKPLIRVDVQKAVDFGPYVSALNEALRGSGLKYNELSSVISQRVSPQELIECVDQFDYDRLSEISSLPKDRAARLLGILRECDVAEILTAEIGDNIQLCLLDGADFKDTTELSAGQRCTVILSIVLQHHERTLVIDQPEDHLDNAFIANTVIKALKERGIEGQVIVSTHNANIPVLGNAAWVVHLTSDGRNGFVQSAQVLHDPESISAITKVMEGGEEAFKERARFYAGEFL